VRGVMHCTGSEEEAGALLALTSSFFQCILPSKLPALREWRG